MNVSVMYSVAIQYGYAEFRVILKFTICSRAVPATEACEVDVSEADDVACTANPRTNPKIGVSVFGRSVWPILDKPVLISRG